MTNKIGGDNAIEAWRKANDNSAGHNACVVDNIVNGSSYYYFKKTVSGGPLGNIYTWEFVSDIKW